MGYIVLQNIATLQDGSALIHSCSSLKNTMKKTLFILFSVLSLNSYSNECDKLKHEIVYHSQTSRTSINTNRLLKKLSVCEWDNYEIALISNSEFFTQAIDEIKKVTDEDVTIGDLTNYFSDFKKNQSHTYKEYYDQTKETVDYYYTELTSENLDEIINDWAENNGKEIAAELKNHAIENKLVDSQNTIKFAVNDFYLIKYEVVVFNDNLNSISWQTSSPESKEQEVDKKYYEERIKISSKRNDSFIIITIDLAEDWNIYSIEKESTNMFKTSIASLNSCLNTSELKVTNERLVSDPMGINGDVKVISGTSDIEIPIEAKCSEPVQIEFTFTLVKNDGSSLPFVKENIEIK